MLIRSIPLGYQQLALGTTTAATLTVPTMLSGGSGATTVPANMAIIGVEAQSLRLRDDGTAPSPGSGFIVTTAMLFEYTGNLNAVQLCAATAGSIANVLYYRVVS